MPTCPRCRQTVDSQAITCPYCRTALKAYGHPGIPLYRAEQGTYLCESCTYHADDTCNFPQRPYAEECTMYHDGTQPLVIERRSPTRLTQWVASWRYRQEWWIILGLVAISILIALASR